MSISCIATQHSEDKSAESPPKRLTTVKSTKKEKLKRLLFFCTRNRGRTGTGITAHRILSPACLPIPPSEQRSPRKDDANVLLLFYSAKPLRKIMLCTDEQCYRSCRYTLLAALETKMLGCCRLD